jgi:hypothetical protein
MNTFDVSCIQKLYLVVKELTMIRYHSLEGDLMNEGQQGIITLIEKDGNVAYAWHAWEGDMEESEIEDWMKDAMYYHHINKEGIP